MAEASSHVVEVARVRAAQRRLDEKVADYQEISELFRRFTQLDSRSIGPELARLQNLGSAVPPQPVGLMGRVRGLFFSLVTPVIGRVIQAVSLTSPSQVAYELAAHLQEQQLRSEQSIRVEIAGLKAKIEALESKLKSRGPLD